MSKEEDEDSYSIEVLSQRRSTWERKGKKNPTAWKSYLKGGAGEEDELQHGSPASKEEQVSKEEDEEPYSMEVLHQRRSRWGGRGRTTAWKFYLKGGAGEGRR